nr:MAG TPA: hypothetical protein [Caudoviricetes sp.]
MGGVLKGAQIGSCDPRAWGCAHVCAYARVCASGVGA